MTPLLTACYFPVQGLACAWSFSVLASGRYGVPITLSMSNIGSCASADFWVIVAGTIP